MGSPPARVAGAPWVAVAADEVECPEAPQLSLVSPATPHWSNERLRFNPDAYRCATTGSTTSFTRPDLESPD